MDKDNDYTRFMPPEAREELAPQFPDSESETVIEEEIKVEEEIIEEEDVPVPEMSLRDSSHGDFQLGVLGGVAKFFYDIFNPLLVPAYATLLLFELSILGLASPQAALPYTLTVLGATAFIPVLLLFLLKRFGAISTISLSRRTERTLPYIVSFLMLGAMTLLFVFRGAPAWMWLIYCGATAVPLVNMLVNFRLRVSSHASAIAALLAMLVVIQKNGMPVHPLGWWAISAALMCGVIGYAAMTVGKHSILEVITGYATGFLPLILFSLI